MYLILGGDTLGRFVACNSCRQQITQCVVWILLCTTSGMPLMFRGNKVAWNRQLVYSGQHVARNTILGNILRATKLMWLHATDISHDTICDVLLLCCYSNKVAQCIPALRLRDTVRWAWFQIKLFAFFFFCQCAEAAYNFGNYCF